MVEASELDILDEFKLSERVFMSLNWESAEEIVEYPSFLSWILLRFNLKDNKCLNSIKFEEINTISSF